MNSSFSATIENGSDLFVSNVTAAFGCVIFVTNACLLSFVTKLLRSGYTKKDKYGIIIQSFFVCINDTFSGLLLFLVGLVKVDNYLSAIFCANLVFMCSASQIVSQGNITCICAQRYILSRSLRKTNIQWSSVYTKTLLATNICIGAGSLASFLAGMKIKNLPERTLTCRLENVVQGEVGFIASALFVLGIPFILAGDTLCLLTIRKLRATVDVVDTKPSNTSSTVSTKVDSANNFTSQSESSISNSIRARQNKATITLLLILLFFNISILPVISAYILLVFGFILSSITQRMLLFSLYANSIANPLIIANRVEDVKNAIKDTALRAWLVIKHVF